MRQKGSILWICSFYPRMMTARENCALYFMKLRKGMVQVKCKKNDGSEKALITFASHCPYQG